MEHKDTIAKYDRTTGAYNSVQAHIYDVSAIAYWLIQTEPDFIQEEFCSGLGINQQSLYAWVAYLAGLHDLMKLSWPFQAMPGISQKFAELNPEIDVDSIQSNVHLFTIQHGYSFIRDQNSKNNIISPLQHALLLPPVLPALLVKTTGVEPEVAQALSFAPEAHHGFVPNENTARLAEKYLIENAEADAVFQPLRQEIVNNLWSHLRFEGIEIPTHACIKSILRLMGIIMHSDHIGSRHYKMPFQNGACRPYAETLLLAKEAVRSYGHQKPEPLTVKPTLEAYGLQARPMQQVVQDLNLSNPYCLFIKSGTGKGKTLAAMIAAMQGTGFLFAANNQTNSNQMYNTAHSVVRKLDPNWEQPVALAHANRYSFLEGHIEKLLEENSFEQAELDQMFSLQKEGINDAITSKYLVCCIDQILMGVFNDGRACYRLHYLTRQINIIDEIHALDGRLEALLLHYLEILGRFRTPVILLSATISSPAMNAYMGAWCEGAGINYESVPLSSEDQILHIATND